jgi:hypothetical protein
MYTGLRQLRLFTTPICVLIDPYFKTRATTSTRFHTHPSTSRYNFTPHSSLHIPLQLHSSPIPTYPAATSFLSHPYVFRCNSNSFPILENDCVVAVALLRYHYTESFVWVCMFSFFVILTSKCRNPT